MVSQAKVRANRRNAKKSTGPRTAEGKARSSRNASTHGIFCEDAVLDGENQKEFEVFREEFIRTLSPQDVMELSLVDEIIMAKWRLRRVRRAEKILHMTKGEELRAAQRENESDAREWMDVDESPATSEPVDVGVTLVALMADSADQNFDRLSKYEQRLQYTISRCMRELRTWRKEKEEEPKLSPYRMMPSPEAHADASPASPRAESSHAQNEPTAIGERRNFLRGMGVSPMSAPKKAMTETVMPRADAT